MSRRERHALCGLGNSADPDARGLQLPRKRHDPPARPSGGQIPDGSLTGQAEDRAYVWANPNDESTGVQNYEALGYEIERYREGGVKPRRGRVQDGQPIMMLGQYLMSCPVEEKVAREAFGAQMADSIDRKILREGSIERDGLRGGGFRVGVDKAHTSPLYQEQAGE